MPKQLETNPEFIACKWTTCLNGSLHGRKIEVTTGTRDQHPYLDLNVFFRGSTAAVWDGKNLLKKAKLSPITSYIHDTPATPREVGAFEMIKKVRLIGEMYIIHTIELIL